MSTITRTYTFTDGTTAYGSQVESEVANIVSVFNLHDSGTNTWTNVKATAVLIGDGSVNTPGASFINSLGMGIWRIQADTMGFGTNSTERMRIGSTGAVIISNALNPITMGGGGGIQVGSPTGGDKGGGTINLATDIYKNNTAYNNPDYVLEKWAKGSIVKFLKNEGAILYKGTIPLSDLEAYMKKHLDLPGVKRAKGLFERSDVILEKMEEAFIYIVGLHNRLKKVEVKTYGS